MDRSHRSRISLLCVLFAVALLAVGPAWADVRLPHVIADHMVLQCEMPVAIWGWAAPGEEVTVAIAGKTAKATAGPDGKWMAKLPALEAGGPHEMTVAGKNKLQVKDILVGEVWVCSGQSNMEMGMGSIQNAKQELAAGNQPKIRLFQVPHITSGLPEQDFNVPWQHCTPQTLAAGNYGGFSATGYFFGRMLQKELGVPIGLIDTSWGGTRIEPWTPPVGFASVEKLKGIANAIKQHDTNYKNALAKTAQEIQAWLPQAEKALAAGERLPGPPSCPRHALNHHQQPTGLYNGMVHPLVPFTIRGALWYQGESNRGDAMLYFEKMKALIQGWRKVWGQGEFPFYYVQLAPFQYKGDPLALPMMWEAQTAALSIPNTGMAVTVDIVHDLKDIHPINKQDVGKRLARWALAKTYGKKDLVYSGPLYKSMAVEGNKIRVRFDHVGGGLIAAGDKPLSCFQIAGADKKFVPAQAKKDGNSVLVWSDEVAQPVAVRFAWDQVAQPNLKNKEGLPASPFRTDRW